MRENTVRNGQQISEEIIQMIPEFWRWADPNRRRPIFFVIRIRNSLKQRVRKT